jgi:hypothetical protein
VVFPTKSKDKHLSSWNETVTPQQGEASKRVHQLWSLGLCGQLTTVLFWYQYSHTHTHTHIYICTFSTYVFVSTVRSFYFFARFRWAFLAFLYISSVVGKYALVRAQLDNVFHTINGDFPEISKHRVVLATMKGKTAVVAWSVVYVVALHR